jgi:uncharacterized protein YecE (DUF72 family)
LKYYLGCSGWSYDGWKGPFYPKDNETGMLDLLVNYEVLTP